MNPEKKDPEPLTISLLKTVGENDELDKSWTISISQGWLSWALILGVVGYVMLIFYWWMSGGFGG